MKASPHAFAALVWLAALVAGSACADDTPEQETSVVDSAVPFQERLDRFRKEIPEVAGLTGGRPSRDSLVRDFITALETSDTTALVEMALTGAEFAWLYYPTNPQAHPPYDLAPDLMWFMLQGNSERGLRRALSLYGGRDLDFRGYRCDAEPSIQGENSVSGPCTVAVIGEEGEHIDVRLLSLIVERNGSFKFVSYANSLD